MRVLNKCLTKCQVDKVSLHHKNVFFVTEMNHVIFGAVTMAKTLSVQTPFNCTPLLKIKYLLLLYVSAIMLLEATVLALAPWCDNMKKESYKLLNH